jgi:hypothetical protein
MTMPDANDAFSTLDDFLLSLADGISQAQGELARAGAQGPPGRQYAYHLPRVDFELKMNLTVVDDAKLSDRYRTLRPVRLNDKHLLFKPASPETTSSMEIAAVVRGAFVAVPANDGLPSVVLSTSTEYVEEGRTIVRVQARNSAGEPIAGLEVQLNIDREESVALTLAATQKPLSISPGTGFDRNVVTTDANGQAEALLSMAEGEQKPGLFALTIDAAGRTETLVYQHPQVAT